MNIPGLGAFERMSPELRKRWLTGIPGAAVFVSLIVFGGWPGVALITAVLTLAMGWEYADIVFAMGDRAEKKYAMLTCAWFAFVGCLFLPSAGFELVIAVFLASFSVFLYLAAKHESAQFGSHLRESALFFFGIVYTAFLPSFLPRIEEQQSGQLWLVLFFLIVWGTDTGAYFAGGRFGGPKLYPAVSPKKTKSGAYGGVAVAWLGSIAFKLLVFRAASWGAVLTAPVLVSVMSQVGDLCESLLKRAFDKKDSGSILPGHGGFLDRFDGVVFGLPVMYACIKVFG